MKLPGLKLRHIVVHKSGHAKHLEAELEAIKHRCELLSRMRAYVIREMVKLLHKKTPPKSFFRWVVEAKEIELQANDILKSGLKSECSSVEGEQLSMYIDDHLKKSPFELDLIIGRPVETTIIIPSSITKAFEKYSFKEKTWMFDIHITKCETKATYGVEAAKERKAEEAMKAAQLPENLYDREAYVTSPPFSSELSPIIKDEMKSKLKIQGIEEMPSRENEKRTSNVIGWTERKSNFSLARDKPEAEFKSTHFPGSGSASMSTLPEKLISTEIAQTEVMPEQTNESKATDDDVGFKELTPNISVQHQVLVTESALAAESTSASSIETEVEPKTIPLPTAEILPMEESKIASISSETKGMLSFPRAEILASTPSEIEVCPPILGRGMEVSASETEKERVKPELNVERTISIIMSRKGRWADLINLQLVICHGDFIKDPGYGEVLLRGDDYLVFVRTNENFEKPHKPKLDQGTISVGEGSSSSFLGSQKRTEISLPEDFFLQEVREGLTEPPPEEKWRQPCVIALMENEFFSLPEKPNCPNLGFLFLQNNSNLGTISDSFFDDMPSLHVLDLSRTGVGSLPPSLFMLTGLQALFLRNCNSLDELPPQVGYFKHIEVLDLLGTEVYNLPDEIAKLTNLRRLLVSFYGADDSSEYDNLPPVLISSKIIPQLHSLQTLSIVVHPVDWRWKNNARAITPDVSSLNELTDLQFYIPEVELLQLFTEKSLSWKAGRLGKFKLVIGQDIKRIVSRVPDDIESAYDKHDQCLRFVNGDGIPKEVVRVLQCVTAFYLDHHCVIKNLSEFEITNFKELKFCVVRECPKIVEIIGNRGRTDSILPCLEHLSMHYLPELKNIWEGPLPQGSLGRLKVLSVHTCPKLEFVLKWSMLHFLSNMEELIIEDCYSVKVIIEMDEQSVDNNGAIIVLPRLNKMKLHYLPQLVSIWNVPNRVWPMSKLMPDFYGCPKLKKQHCTTWT
ncbi:hypothetical protein ACSBR2_015217 [Camellia fascicularis]